MIGKNERFPFSSIDCCPKSKSNCWTKTACCNLTIPSIWVALGAGLCTRVSGHPEKDPLRCKRNCMAFLLDPKHTKNGKPHGSQICFTMLTYIWNRKKALPAPPAGYPVHTGSNQPSNQKCSVCVCAACAVWNVCSAGGGRRAGSEGVWWWCVCENAGRWCAERCVAGVQKAGKGGVVVQSVCVQSVWQWCVVVACSMVQCSVVVVQCVWQKNVKRNHGKRGVCVCAVSCRCGGVQYGGGMHA